MAEKQERFAELDWGSRLMVKQCVDTVWWLNAAPSTPYTGAWLAPVNRRQSAMAMMQRVFGDLADCSPPPDTALATWMVVTVIILGRSGEGRLSAVRATGGRLTASNQVRRRF
jgi:hypothetical protein